MNEVRQPQIFFSLPLRVLSKPPLPAGLLQEHCKAAQQESSKTPVNLLARVISLRLWGWRDFIYFYFYIVEKRMVGERLSAFYEFPTPHQALRVALTLSQGCSDVA